MSNTTLVILYQTTWHHIRQVNNRRSRLSENLTSHYTRYHFRIRDPYRENCQGI